MLTATISSKTSWGYVKSFWKTILIALMVAIGSFSSKVSLAEPTTVIESVAYVTDEKKNLHISAFFIGRRGYLLTSFSNPENVKIGDQFKIEFWNSKHERTEEQMVAVIDLSDQSGIALLRLINMQYPFEHAIITADHIDTSYSLKGGSEVDIYYMGPSSARPQKSTCKIPDLIPVVGGHLKLKRSESFKKSMVGAPVFFEGRLIGIVSDKTSFHPINHATPYVTMAESTIIGKKAIRSLIEDMAEWTAIKRFIDHVRLRPAVAPKLIPITRSDGIIRYEFKADVEKPFGVEYDPTTITAMIYPEWSYPASITEPENRKTVTWAQTKKKNRNLAFKYDYPQSNKELNTNIPIILRKGLPLPIIDLKNNLIEVFNLEKWQREELSITGVQVELEWMVQGKSRDGQPAIMNKIKRDTYLKFEKLEGLK